MGAKRSLAALAQTCPAFSEPALDALWYELHDLLPLVQCMPRDLWTQSGSQREPIRFQRPIVPTDWPRFVYHAGRVRKFIHSAYGFEARDAFRIVSLGSITELLLPQLRELWWDDESDGSVFTCIRHFLGPHITRLHVCLGDPYDVTSRFTRLSFIHTLPSRYPSLTHLHLIDPLDSDSAAFVDPVSHAVCCWGQLRQLTVSRLSPNALYHVAALPTLECLTLTNVTEDISHLAFSRSSTVHFFPYLQKLEVTCESDSFAIGLVKAISSSTLASISVDSWQSGYQDLINALRDHCSRSPVESMSITGEHEDESIPTSVVNVKPLFVFSDLTRVKFVGFDAELELDDTSLKDMAQAWPHITSLILRCHSRVTLCGLVPLAQYCLKLQYLDIFFDPCPIPPPDTEFLAVKNEALRVLDFSQTLVAPLPIAHSERVAAFIHGVFPRAHLTCAFNTEWSEVAHTLQAYCRDAIADGEYGESGDESPSSDATEGTHDKLTDWNFGNANMLLPPK